MCGRRLALQSQLDWLKKKTKKKIPLQDVNTNNKKLAHIGIFPFCDVSVAVFRVY